MYRVYLELKAKDQLEEHGERVLNRIRQNLRSTEKMSMTEIHAERML